MGLPRTNIAFGHMTNGQARFNSGARSGPDHSIRQRFDAVTYQQIDPKPEAMREEKHEFRVFRFLGVPIGLVLAFFVTLANDIGTAGFFYAWLILAVIIGGFFGSMSSKETVRIMDDRNCTRKELGSHR